ISGCGKTSVGGQMALRSAGRGDRGCEQSLRNVSFPRGGSTNLPVFLGRLLRLVHRVGQAGIAERQFRTCNGCVEKSVCGVRRGTTTFAPGHALLDRRTVAPASTRAGRQEYRARRISGSLRVVEESRGARGAYFSAKRY